MGENGIERSVRESDKNEGEVMETPDRSKANQIVVPINKIEDSPVFNFLNNLSPIKPFKSIHVSETMDPLYFASISSVFTSPHANSQGNSTTLRRHQVPDSSKTEFASDGEKIVQESRVDTDADKQLEVHVENLKSAGEASFDCLQFMVDPYNVGNPNSSCVLEANSSRLVSCVPDTCQRVQYGSEEITEGKKIDDQNKEITSSDWDSLISNAMNFESPVDKDSYKIPNDPSPSFFTTIENEINAVSLQLGKGSKHDPLYTQPGEGKQISDAREILNVSSASCLGEETDCEPSGSYHGTRRRCLVFEIGGSGRKHLEENFGHDSSLTLQPESNNFSNDQSLVLPGIGLHLNAIATNPNDSRILSHDSSSSRRLLIGPNSLFNFHSSTSNQQLHNDSLSVAIDGEDHSHESAYITIEDVNQSGSKKKRRKAEPPGDGEGCKQCNCKKSKCLKLYCECFAAGVYCMELCACVDCFNKPVNEDTVLATRKQIESRNPIAFAPKVIRGSETGDYSTKTPASARHKRGCNCKKSGCLKKYCECFQGGVGCSVNCRCEGCKNVFGKKDGMETEGECDAIEKSKSDEILLEKNPDSCVPQMTIRKMIKKREMRSSEGKFDEHTEELVKEDEMANELSSCVVKCSSSPNGKRVSSSTTGLRSSRKLILQSIPSFPSLTQNL